MTIEKNNPIKEQLDSIFNTVVDGGYCIGCGVCASVTGSPVEIKLDDYGRLQATIEPGKIDSSVTASIDAVCPFADRAIDEDRLGQELFSQDCTYHNKIGYHLATYAGYVRESEFRDRGSSGGMGTWIVSSLLRHNLVDGVIHVRSQHPTATNSRLFKYQISTTLEQVYQGAKSRYYPIELSEVLKLVRAHPGRYALVGIPCFIKAVRLLSKQDEVLAERIRFYVGLVCGHLKSTNFAEMFAWQCGIEPGKLMDIDFRKKIPDRDANKYGVELTGIIEDQTVTKTKPVLELQGYDWGQGFFKYKACDYCDDVVAETADVVVGDAWLPQYVKDSQGTNIIIVRNSTIKQLIDRALDRGELHLDSIDAQEVAQSQSSGFKHRREGLAYRLYLAEQQNRWHPPKRTKASKNSGRKLRKIMEMRLLLAQESHLAFKEAKEAGDFNLFTAKMQPLIDRYRALYAKSLWERIGNKSKKLVKRLLNSLEEKKA